MKSILAISILLAAVPGCTYRPVTGTWIGPLVSITTYDRHGREYEVAGFNAEGGTPIHEPYTVADVAYTILVDREIRAYPFNQFQLASGTQVQVKGIMKRRFIWSFDGTEALGSKFFIGHRANYNEALVIVAKQSNVRRMEGAGETRRN